MATFAVADMLAIYHRLLHHKAPISTDGTLTTSSRVGPGHRYMVTGIMTCTIPGVDRLYELTIVMGWDGVDVDYKLLKPSLAVMIQAFQIVSGPKAQPIGNWVGLCENAPDREPFGPCEVVHALSLDPVPQIMAVIENWP